jgi:hypothetical protein
LVTWNTPLWFDPSNLDITNPKEAAFDIAMLNFRTSKEIEESICPVLLSASTHVAAGSQQFDNQGPYISSARINMTALAKIVYSDCSAILLSTECSLFDPQVYLQGNCWHSVANQECSFCVERHAISLWNACF